MDLANTINVRYGFRLMKIVAQLAQSDLIAQAKSKLALPAMARACSGEAMIELQ
tara:strand:+ start:2224 stop:2385 length:162 start_codon:yes stop_codon:yes gene_type:complete